MEEKNNKKIVKTIIFQYIGAAIFTFLMILYQKNTSLLGYVNAMQVSGITLFVIGWFVYINHFGLFDVAIYGVQAFFKSLVGKTMEKKLYEVRLAHKKMPKYLYLSFWINGIIIVAVSYILYYSLI